MPVVPGRGPAPEPTPSALLPLADPDASQPTAQVRSAVPPGQPPKLMPVADPAGDAPTAHLNGARAVEPLEPFDRLTPRDMAPAAPLNWAPEPSLKGRAPGKLKAVVLADFGGPAPEADPQTGENPVYEDPDDAQETRELDRARPTPPPQRTRTPVDQGETREVSKSESKRTPPKPPKPTEGHDTEAADKIAQAAATKKVERQLVVSFTVFGVLLLCLIGYGLLKDDSDGDHGMTAISDPAGRGSGGGASGGGSKGGSASGGAGKTKKKRGGGGGDKDPHGLVMMADAIPGDDCVSRCARRQQQCSTTCEHSAMCRQHCLEKAAVCENSCGDGPQADALDPEPKVLECFDSEGRPSACSANDERRLAGAIEANRLLCTDARGDLTPCKNQQGVLNRAKQLAERECGPDMSRCVDAAQRAESK